MRIIADLLAGKINPRIVAVLTPLLNLQLRAIEPTDLEQRIKSLEKLVGKDDKDPYRDTDPNEERTSEAPKRHPS